MARKPCTNTHKQRASPSAWSDSSRDLISKTMTVGACRRWRRPHLAKRRPFTSGTSNMSRLKICVFGAGAIGGYLAAELALAGFDVCAIARGAHLEAIRRNGIVLRLQGQEKLVRLPASDDPRDFGPQDFVICALKAQQAWES